MPDYEPPRLRATALLHGHCHQKALIGLDAERSLLQRIGVDTQVPDSGCCGMAGSFGFERDRYEVSIAIGERVLLPAVRRASADTLLVADGFSCREQIAQTTGRHAWHLAEVLRPGTPTADAMQPAKARRRRTVTTWELAGAFGVVAAATLPGAARAASAAPGLVISNALISQGGEPNETRERGASVNGDTPRNVVVIIGASAARD